MDEATRCAIESEIRDLEAFQRLALSIEHNAKGRALLVALDRAFQEADRLEKRPKAVLARCEWSHDDYSLEVENLPAAPPKEGQQSLFREQTATMAKRDGDGE
ncbi:MAG: hypothetical protein ACYCWW_17500 [Deltaproteobacteria bacterium]